jgi:periplasmic protein TonB
MAPGKQILSGTSAPQSAVAQSIAQSKPAPPNLRPDAVSLEVAVKVHGSRPGSANSPGERFEEQASTMIVFPEGGVLRLATPVTAGQMLVLTNLKSRQDAICRVVKVRSFESVQSYVEVEFTRPQAEYWGVYFPSRNRQVSDAKSANALATPPPAPAAAPAPLIAPNLPSAPKESVAPAPVHEALDLPETSLSELPLPPAPPLNETRIYSTELSFTEPELHIAGSPDSAFKTLSPPISGQRAAATPPRAAQPEHAAASLWAPKTSPAQDLGGPSLAAPSAVSSDALGFRLDTVIARSEPLSSMPRSNWMLIAVGIVALLGTVAGGAWYFQRRIANHSAAPVAGTNTVAQQPAQPIQQPPRSAESHSAAESVSHSAVATQPPAPAVQVASIPANEPSSSSTKREFAGPSRVTPAPKKAQNAESGSSAGTSGPSAAAQPPSSAATDAVANPASVTLANPAMKAHPLSAQRSISLPNQAPAVDESAASTRDPGNLPELGSSSLAVAPPPEAQPQGPVRAGGMVQEPKLISSVMPVYPFAAKEANIQGDIVINTQIAADGSVAHMKVVSGPAMLRQAALDALRRWKYQPSRLDGKPVAVEMLVTIRFRL